MNQLAPERRHIFTVIELTEAIKEVLEATHPFVWVTGEISNLHFALSGHCYFTLKDDQAQIAAVMFRGQNRALRFALEDGLTVIAMGRLNVYEPKGVYQLIMEYIEPSGLGALQLAFQQLKDRLEAEGLFREERKIAPPLLPRTVAVVTSPKGAAIHDIFSVIGRRYPNINLLVVPVAVQGAEAETTIAHALSMVNVNDHADVIILARGGGSLEDLQAYNSELVARAIAASHIPVVTGIGHETDLTIADLAADLRAPTPSAAAELVVPEKTSLQRMIEGRQSQLERAIRARLASLREILRYATSRLVHPGRRVAEFRLRLDDKVARIHSGCLRRLEAYRHRLAVSHHRLRRQALRARLDRLNTLLEQTVKSLSYTMAYLLKQRRHELGVLVAGLNGLNPLRILERGYSITRRLADGALLTDVANVDLESQVAVTLFRGEMVCAVKRKKEHGQAKL